MLIINYSYYMEAEQQSMRWAIEDEQGLKQVIAATFSGQTHHIVKQAEEVLAGCSSHSGFVQTLARLIGNSHPNEINIRKGAANLIKKISYDFSETQRDNFGFIETIYKLITQEQLETTVKQLLGTALEHQFSQPQNAALKKIVKEKILQRFANQEAIAIFDSCIIIFQAYFNSLINQPEEMLDFFTEIIQPVCAAALQIYQIISKMSIDQWAPSEHTIVCKLQLLFQFFSLSLNALVEEKDDLEEGLAMIRANNFLIGLFESYLLLFHNNHSIISALHPSTNSLKSKITKSIKVLYQDFQCPQKMFHIIFLTVILEARPIVHEKEAEEILVHSLKILEAHLELKVYSNIFKQHKMEIIFALLMYSVTSSQEYFFIENDPQVFVQYAQEFTEGITESYHLKANAASMLELFAEKIDQAPRSFLQVIMAIMSETIGAEDPNSDLIKYMQAHFSKFAFYQMNGEHKLEACLMVLCVLSNQISKRQDMNKTIYGFFLTNFEVVKSIQSPIVVLRIIRTISYYPSALYFMYIQTQMAKGKVFVLEGIKSLERILRTNRHPQLYQLLSSIFQQIMRDIHVMDPLMELLVINYYDRMLKPNPQLYAACRSKIKQDFFINVNKNQHATLICLNLLYSLLRNQRNPQHLLLVEKQLYQISGFIQQHKQLYEYYEQKLIEIYQAIMQKYMEVKPQIERFAFSTLSHLHLKQKGSQIFRFYNQYLARTEGRLEILQIYFAAFWQQIQLRYEQYLKGRESLDAIPYFCFLVSQLIASKCDHLVSEGDCVKWLHIGQGLPQGEKQYTVLVLLTLLFVNPSSFLTFLKRCNAYSLFLSEVSKIQYQGAICKKIFNLAYVTIMQLEKDAAILKQVVVQCVKNLKQLNSQAFKKNQTNHKIEIKARRFTEQAASNQSELRRKPTEDNQLISLFINFKHPLAKISEFQLFKNELRAHEYLIKDLEQSTKFDLRQVMEIEILQKGKTRIIKKIKK